MTYFKPATLAGCLAVAISSYPAFAQDTFLMDGVTAREGDNPVVEADKYKKDCPWTIGMSHFGVNANTWTVQVAHESEAAAAKNDCITKFILLDAGFDQKKQVADIEDLVAQNVDAIIVQPVTSTSADASIAKAVAAGIPVVLHTGRIESDAYTTEIQGGAEHFGKVMGDWLVNEVGTDGKIWVLRGLAGHPEDTNRYNGLLQSLEGTNVEVIAEEHGDWQYDKAKNLCETLYLNNPSVDGIWSSGADMTRACVDVFKQFGAEIPPISGEGNNGFFGQWIRDGFKSVSAEYAPAQGAAGVRAAVALLEGKELKKHYDYNPAGWDVDKAKQYYREDLSANVWWPTELPEEKLQELYGKK
ncbi:substrate-binding domain-containing protein (plasmid) [Roseibium aggregatum]|uniref:substrate-binding domain-containing protein n=1 Tax=Stappiaceae TaxID=2821832 RepID=UPI00126826F2|nr:MULTISPECIES: substrate-binding domain-containing protein [Stappiaceae]MEC9417214.1 substrate-binding domain-containing protein [Pseudomonadota bacterium]QFT70890.1 ABC transporter periplasmic-binding protein YtfQ precursor [Labrenzia sp. THAF35]UES59367.1 substrate-binding domain-containing protein [Roseibium aggregatum]UES59728.1 substrate-binding domain-containing protein [Roseibium aggregatum]WJS06163.1 substrate-binding domain-containing protein [Roseibium aggregatum]